MLLAALAGLTGIAVGNKLPPLSPTGANMPNPWDKMCPVDAGMSEEDATTVRRAWATAPLTDLVKLGKSILNSHPVAAYSLLGRAYLVEHAEVVKAAEPAAEAAAVGTTEAPAVTAEAIALATARLAVKKATLNGPNVMSDITDEEIAAEAVQ